MKSVLISIQPKWCELIASGKKTVEVQKTRPKLETPFKVYIYCTDAKGQAFFTDESFGRYAISHLGNSKVIGEFVCDRIDTIGKRGADNNFDYCYLSLNVFGNDDIEIEIADVQRSCIPKHELNAYGESAPCLYAWHITDLVIYDKPRELSEFLIDCKNCGKKFVGDPNCWQGCVGGYRRLTRPPQSWCYVEETE